MPPFENGRKNEAISRFYLIDSHKDPAMDCARETFKPGWGNDTTGIMVDGMYYDLNSGGLGDWIFVVIHAHGCPGVFTTGMGDGVMNDSNKFIATWNTGDWQSRLATIPMLIDKKYSVLIHACNTGAGDSGADLLFEIARTLKVEVAAPSGMAKCSGGEEPGSVWVVATPTKRPTPVSPPTTVVKASELSRDIWLQRRRGTVKLPRRSVSKFAYHSGRNDAEHVVLAKGEEAQYLSSLVRFSMPFRLAGPINSLITGSVNITFHESKGERFSRRFHVHNESLLEDAEYRLVYYNAGLAFRDFTRFADKGLLH